jgi:bifunctional enzyme CysN/CysC
MDTLASPSAFEALLQRQEAPDLLRLLTCGSVDDGKSTLIGRLLYDSQSLMEDQLASLRARSGKAGALDFALLLDGLQAEREQGITIDVAYRFFATPRRRFIVADTPGHEQYTRNMATGASTADLAILLVDVRKGVLTQTRRHAYIASLLGIRHVVLAANKMDLADYEEAAFAKVAADFAALARALGFATAQAIPVSAVKGDNLVSPSPAMPWYDGPALLPFLETVETRSPALVAPFRLPVQWVNRPHQDFRGYSGRIEGGGVRPGDVVIVLPSRRQAIVDRILAYEGDLAEAVAGQSVTVTLDRHLDLGRGDVLAAASLPAEIADQFAAHLLWMGEEPMLPGRQYLLRLGTQTVPAQVSAIKHRVDVNTLQRLAAKKLAMNEVGFCDFALGQAIAFDPYAANRAMGGFILIDRVSNATVGCGMVSFALRRAANITWQHLDIDKTARAAIKGQKPGVLWFTGLSGAGKSTIANLLEKRLHALGRHTYLIDGDNLRHGLNRDLGFTPESRVENMRRAGEVARLMADAGLIVLVSLISPFRQERDMVRALMAEGEFLEIHVDTPLAECERRDPKGLYRKARAGRLANFTGIDSPYEAPLQPELVVTGHDAKPEAAVEQLLALLRRRHLIEI